jgi:hypothetical protein
MQRTMNYGVRCSLGNSVKYSSAFGFWYVEAINAIYLNDNYPYFTTKLRIDDFLGAPWSQLSKYLQLSVKILCNETLV